MNKNLMQSMENHKRSAPKNQLKSDKDAAALNRFQKNTGNKMFSLASFLPQGFGGCKVENEGGVHAAAEETPPDGDSILFTPEAVEALSQHCR